MKIETKSWLLEKLHFVYGLTGWRSECTKMWAGQTGLESRQGQGLFIFSNTPRAVLWPTLLSIQFVRGSSPGYNGRSMKLNSPPSGAEVQIDWRLACISTPSICLNPLNHELNPICYLLELLGAHHFLHVSRIRVKSLTLRRLMSYIYGAPILDVSRSHTTTQHSR